MKKFQVNNHEGQKRREKRNCNLYKSETNSTKCGMQGNTGKNVVAYVNKKDIWIRL